MVVSYHGNIEAKVTPSGDQEIPRILWNSMVQYHVDSSQQVEPILRRLSPVHIPTPYF